MLGRAIDEGLATGDSSTLLAWAGALLGLGVVQAVAGTLRHRVAVSNWLQSAFRMMQLVAHHAALTGPAIRSRLTTGEVVATVSNDALRAGGAFDITARLAGAIASYFVVAAVLLSTSTFLGLVVLLGVPILVATLSFVIKPLQARQREQREEVGQLTALGADTVAGLRVLRGIGGERVFLDRYRRRSQEVRRAGVRVALPAVDARLRPGAPARDLHRHRHLARRPLRDPRAGSARASSSRSTATPPSSSSRSASPPRRSTRSRARSSVRSRMLDDPRGSSRLVAEPEAPASEPPPGRRSADARSGLVVEPGLAHLRGHARPRRGQPVSPTGSGASSDDGLVTFGGVPLGRSRSP